MKKNESPCTQFNLLMFLLLILALASLLGSVGCGGGSSGSTSTGGGGNGGGGGGGGGSVPACTFTPSKSVTTTGAGLNTTVGNHYFGMHLNSTNAPWPFYDVAGSQVPLPFSSQRLWAAGVAWAQVNTAQGIYGWTTAPQNMDTWMSDAQAHPGVDELYTLARTPSWASQQPGDNTCVDTAGGGGQCDPPIHLNSDGSGTNDVWIAWVTAAAQYSVAKKAAGEPGFSYYEIWNEWNTSVSWNPQYSTTKQLVRMEQDARCVVEGPPAGMACNPNSVFPNGTAIDPTAKIVSPSPVGAAADNMLGTVASSLSTYFSTVVNGYPGGSFSDAIGFHGYVGTTTSAGTNAVPCPTAENVNIVMADLEQTLASFSSITAGKPLFNTEGGWSEATNEGFIDPERQAAFLPRYLLLQESDNVGRVYWFAWDSKTDASLYNDSTTQASPAATAYAEVNAWTNGATVSNACTAAGSVWTCGFTRPGGYAALAVWDASQDCTATNCPTTTFTVPGGGYIEYRDVNDDTETQLNGSTTVQIGAKPILLETGPLPPT
jgi:hypothetical protein